MYMPAHFEETRAEVMHRLIHEYPLAVLVTLGSSGLYANHIPLEIDSEPAPLGTLRGHVARANPVWRDFSRDIEALPCSRGRRRTSARPGIRRRRRRARSFPPSTTSSSMLTDRCASSRMRPGFAV